MDKNERMLLLETYPQMFVVAPLIDPLKLDLRQVGLECHAFVNADVLGITPKDKNSGHWPYPYRLDCRLNVP